MTEKELGDELPEITRYNSEQRRDYLRSLVRAYHPPERRVG